MRIISSDEIDACLEDRAVLETLRRAFRSNTIAPNISDQEINRPGPAPGHISFQPAWTDFAAQGDLSRGYIGCSIALELPEKKGQASSLYVLFSGSGGEPIALIDGARLSAWRAAGVHALAAAYLSREDTSRLLVVGEDPRLPKILSAYAAVRNFTSILLAGTSRQTHKRIAAQRSLANVHVGVTTEIIAAQEGADMICVAGPDSDTQSYHALTYLDPSAGCHIDVLDPSAVLPSDLLEEARLFSSDLAAPPRTELEWAADLKELAQGSKAGRRYYGQRTLFLPGPQTGLTDYALAAHIFLRS
ncbi:MAG: ornithine cyclodeaminase [Roseibium sp.]|uniref:ornithine cyclodeaminase n=1 Tax=Roseibium sp. TaxID=1936156 RepID=UPI00261EC675|nr:ornithine cyclodeaminase [Roseibium sp.]MCV0428394.1 ornithine cyclodeaminase [Roseibium sp.]